MLRRRFTMLENGLLIVLTMAFFFCFYYGIFLRPVASELKQNRQELELMQEEKLLQMERAARKDRMLEALADSPERLPGILPDYDNGGQVLGELEEVLSSALWYEMDAEIPFQEEEIVRRIIRIRCRTASYEQALELVKAIEQGTYRCQISDVEIVVLQETEEVETDLLVTYFERSVEDVGYENQ